LDIFAFDAKYREQLEDLIGFSKIVEDEVDTLVEDDPMRKIFLRKYCQ
jgi:hypothetical protein